MRIARIEAIPVRIPLKPERRMVSALGRHEVSDFVLVRLTTDDGLQGVGEATVTPNWSGETVWSARAIIEHLFTPALIGCDPRDCHVVVSDTDLTPVDMGAYSSRGTYMVGLACIEAGASDYVTKPVDLEQLFSVMRVWVANPDSARGANAGDRT